MLVLRPRGGAANGMIGAQACCSLLPLAADLSLRTQRPPQ
jgi:hypothetical protein